MLILGILAIWFWSWARETLAGNVHIGLIAIEPSAIVFVIGFVLIAAGLWRGRANVREEPRSFVAFAGLTALLVALSFVIPSALAALDTRLAFLTLRPRMERLVRLAPRGTSSRECTARLGEVTAPGDSACVTDSSARYLGVSPAADDSSNYTMARAAAEGFFDTETRLRYVAFMRVTRGVGQTSGFLKLRENAPATRPAQLFGFPVAEWTHLQGQWYHFRTTPTPTRVS